jgi:PII-like signaling protein
MGAEDDVADTGALMATLMPYLLVGVGGFIGANARFVVARLVGALFETRFPLGTFVINTSGSFPLYEWIVETAHREGLQGATVLKGFFGLSPEGSVLEEHTWSISQELPVIVEVVDEPARIETLLARVEPVFREGVITLERAHVLIYRAGPKRNEASLTGRNIIATASASAAAGVRTMRVPENGVLLRIFIGESDREPGGDRPLYEAIVRRAREAQLAGATVLRGPMGFGRHSRVHTAKLFELSTDLPILIEIVDSEEKVDAFLPAVDELVTEGLVTLEAVRIVRYVSPDSR